MSQVEMELSFRGGIIIRDIVLFVTFLTLSFAILVFLDIEKNTRMKTPNVEN